MAEHASQNVSWLQHTVVKSTPSPLPSPTCSSVHDIIITCTICVAVCWRLLVENWAANCDPLRPFWNARWCAALNHHPSIAHPRVPTKLGPPPAAPARVPSQGLGFQVRLLSPPLLSILLLRRLSLSVSRFTFATAGFIVLSHCCLLHHRYSRATQLA